MIDAVTALLPTSAHVLIGPGDDAAVLAASDGRVVVTTDMLVESVHFRRDWSSAYDIGRKAAAQNLADVVAMGARPTALVLAFAAPPDLPLRWATDLARGMANECARVGAVVAGGDMARADVVVLSVTALGDLEGRAPVRRSGARPGDLVLLAGGVGSAAAGLALLESSDARLIEQFADLVAAHRSPSPSYESGLALAELGATAMIDVSDGLSSELHHLARASGVAIAIDDVVPAARLSAAGAALGADAREWVLHGGEDHAILATVPPELTNAAAVWTTCIGVVGTGEGVTMAGEPLTARGWDHFRGRA
ncbi:MAG: thiamine-monophosphate kinase [Frankiaceae bacterium]|nr:thiamine-monophosphate kinase [Frankiaceae bacterium]